MNNMLAAGLAPRFNLSLQPLISNFTNNLPHEIEGAA
jgi:hypothetical protein